MVPSAAELAVKRLIDGKGVSFQNGLTNESIETTGRGKVVTLEESLGFPEQLPPPEESQTQTQGQGQAQSQSEMEKGAEQNTEAGVRGPIEIALVSRTKESIPGVEGPEAESTSEGVSPTTHNRDEVLPSLTDLMTSMGLKKLQKQLTNIKSGTEQKVVSQPLQHQHQHQLHRRSMDGQSFLPLVRNANDHMKVAGAVVGGSVVSVVSDKRSVVSVPPLQRSMVVLPSLSPNPNSRHAAQSEKSSSSSSFRSLRGSVTPPIGTL